MRKYVLELVCNISVKNGIEHHFNTEKKRTGKHWLREFRRNPGISNTAKTRSNIRSKSAGIEQTSSGSIF